MPSKTYRSARLCRRQKSVKRCGVSPYGKWDLETTQARSYWKINQSLKWSPSWWVKLWTHKYQFNRNKTNTWLVCLPAKLAVGKHETFQADRKLHITAPNHVLYFEIKKFCLWRTKERTFNQIWNRELAAVEDTHRKSKFLNNSSVLSGSQPRILFTLRSCTHHFARTENKGRSSRFTNSHDDCCETLGVVFGVTGVESNFLQV